MAASVAIYMVAVGIAALLWGPMGDRYGRKLSYYTSSAAFLASSLICLFAPNIGVLVAFRALQGAAGTAAACTLTQIQQPAAWCHAMALPLLECWAKHVPVACFAPCS